MQTLVLMVPVFFGIIGFGLDLGRLYLIRGELSQAAEAMALAAAQELIGTDRSSDAATEAANLVLNNGSGFGTKYNFGSIVIGESSGILNSTVSPLALYSAAVDALSAQSTGGTASGSTAKYVRVDLEGDAPLVFWATLSLGQERKTPIAASAVAGISAPVCTACGIEAFAVAAISQDDTTDFGFVQATKYTLAHQCNGNPAPQPLAGSSQVVRYLLLNRLNDQSTLEEFQQLYRIGAQGLLPSTDRALACFTINQAEQIWASATPVACAQGRPQAAIAALCGLASRFDTVPPTACSIVTDVDSLSSSYDADLDTSDIDDYPAYTGAGRRVITIPIVDALNPGGDMLVLGFRQFLIEPNQDDVVISPGDQTGRFRALYIGSPMPVKQGRMEGGCQAASGPGKVVLHQ